MLKTLGLKSLPVIFLLGVLQACDDTQIVSTEQADIASDNSGMLAEADRIVSLQNQLAELQAQAQRVKDSNDIKRLQRAYGYYVDEALWDEVVNLLADNATLELARDGVYKGKARIREYLDRLNGGSQGLKNGQLNEHFQLMPVVTLGEDGVTAKGRWRAIIMSGQLGESALWGEGPYENEYVKENGVWKISKLRWYETIMVPYEGGWAENETVTQGLYVSPEFPPDEPSSDDYGYWPETFLPPFHFDNPVGTYQPAEAVNTSTEGVQ